MPTTSPSTSWRDRGPEMLPSSSYADLIDGVRFFTLTDGRVFIFVPQPTRSEACARMFVPRFLAARPKPNRQRANKFEQFKCAMQQDVQTEICHAFKGEEVKLYSKRFLQVIFLSRVHSNGGVNRTEQNGFCEFAGFLVRCGTFPSYICRFCPGEFDNF